MEVRTITRNLSARVLSIPRFIPRSIPWPALLLTLGVFGGLMVACQPGGKDAAASDAAGVALHQLFTEEWEFQLRTDPLFATQVGDHRFNDQLPSVSEAALAEKLEAARGFLERWEALDPGTLSAADRVHHAIFGRLLKDRIQEGEFHSETLGVTDRNGFHVEFPRLPEQAPFQTVQDYDHYIARLNGFAHYAEEQIALLRAGLASGWVQPRVVAQGIPPTVRAQLSPTPEESRFYDPLNHFPGTVPPGERDRLRTAASAAIEGSILPGYQEFLRFIEEEYLPATRETVGVSALPGGEDFYNHRVRRFTTLDDATPQRVHQTGLREVARIRAEMEGIREEVGFEGDLSAFLQFLRTDPRFYATTPEALMASAALIAKRMDGELPRLFGQLPRMPYGLRAVPDYLAPNTYTAYYERPAGDGSRAGFYFLNTYDLKSRPLYELEALSLHESVPGHHLQIALQQELGDLPPFRRFAGVTAFVEGWALYAERLGLEVGFYQDPYSDFGRLTYEMWRACRLVVDTGIHHLGWSRQQAIDFMAENSALSLHNITTEVDRYIGWPGQALAYKTGELKIRELRAKAEDTLGNDFDVRRFHDVVLGSGAVPLAVLEEQVDAYLAAAKDPEP
jgi:uncharacterized protein (DUF885 family)